MVRFLINIPTELRDRLRSIANKHGQTLNGLIRNILWDWIKAQDEKARAKEEWTKPHS